MMIWKEPTNADRRQRARNTLDAYLDELGESQLDRATISDLLCDLMHLSAYDTDNHDPFADSLRCAEMNYAEERDTEL